MKYKYYITKQIEEIIEEHKDADEISIGMGGDLPTIAF